MTQIEEEAAVAAAEQTLPVAEDEEPERAGLLCSPIDTTQSPCAAANFSDASFFSNKWLNLAKTGPCVLPLNQA